MSASASVAAAATGASKFRPAPVFGSLTPVEEPVQEPTWDEDVLSLRSMAERLDVGVSYVEEIVSVPAIQVRIDALNEELKRLYAVRAESIVVVEVSFENAKGDAQVAKAFAAMQEVARRVMGVGKSVRENTVRKYQEVQEVQEVQQRGRSKSPSRARSNSPSRDRDGRRGANRGRGGGRGFG